MSATKTVAEIVSWIDRALDVKSFDDVSNNGLQIARTGGEVSRVAFAARRRPARSSSSSTTAFHGAAE